MTVRGTLALVRPINRDFVAHQGVLRVGRQRNLCREQGRRPLVLGRGCRLGNQHFRAPHTRSFFIGVGGCDVLADPCASNVVRWSGRPDGVLSAPHPDLAFGVFSLDALCAGELGLRVVDPSNAKTRSHKQPYPEVPVP